MKNLVRSKKFKNFMSKLYGWGASIVIVGALFKIQHWKFAGLFLTIGLLTEATIFFFSAFEPLHEELDWTLVYPELAGMSDQEETEEMKELNAGLGGRPLERIENLLGEANISESTLKGIGVGLEKLNTAASGIAEISGATAATQEFLQSMLESFAFRVTTAQSAESGLLLLDQPGDDPFGLMLLDWNLPGGMDGLEAARRIRQDARLANTPIILLVSKEEVLQKVNAEILNGSLVKPITRSQLFDAVITYLPTFVKF